MRIGSIIMFAVATISISDTFKLATRAIDSDQVWLVFLLAVGQIVTSIVCAYVGFSLFRKGL